MFSFFVVCNYEKKANFAVLNIILNEMSL